MTIATAAEAQGYVDAGYAYYVAGEMGRDMALNRYVLTATVTVPADTIATVVAGEPGTGGASGFGSAQSVSPADGHASSGCGR